MVPFGFLLRELSDQCIQYFRQSSNNSAMPCFIAKAETKKTTEVHVATVDLELDDSEDHETFRLSRIIYGSSLKSGSLEVLVGCEQDDADNFHAPPNSASLRSSSEYSESLRSSTDDCEYSEDSSWEIISLLESKPFLEVSTTIPERPPLRIDTHLAQEYEHRYLQRPCLRIDTKLAQHFSHTILQRPSLRLDTNVTRNFSPVYTPYPVFIPASPDDDLTPATEAEFNKVLELIIKDLGLMGDPEFVMAEFDKLVNKPELPERNPERLNSKNVTEHDCDTDSTWSMDVKVDDLEDISKISSRSERMVRTVKYQVDELKLSLRGKLSRWSVRL